MEDPAHAQLLELTADECWELLASSVIGRIAWTTTRGPVVLPVNFAVDGRALHVRTPAYSALVQKADAERVAFEVDRIDEETRTGWSVLARGLAEVRYGGAEKGPEVDSWPSRPKSATVIIAVDEISGRRLTAP